MVKLGSNGASFSLVSLSAERFQSNFKIGLVVELSHRLNVVRESHLIPLRNLWEPLSILGWIPCPMHGPLVPCFSLYGSYGIIGFIDFMFSLNSMMLEGFDGALKSRRRCTDKLSGEFKASL